MSVPLAQMWAVASHVVRNNMRGVKRYPLVLMLEPLFRCNLTCEGCGKIRRPADVMRRQLTPQQCHDASDECGAPIVSIPGGEPLLHPQIDEIVAGLVKRKRFVYLCTNGLRLTQSLDKFTPSKYLSFSVHLDGPRADHDRVLSSLSLGTGENKGNRDSSVVSVGSCSFQPGGERFLATK